MQPPARPLTKREQAFARIGDTTTSDSTLSSGSPKTNQKSVAHNSVFRQPPERHISSRTEKTTEPSSQPNGGASLPSRAQRDASDDFMTHPFVHRHGRRFLRAPELNYILPVDLEELHRQSLKTLMLMRVHGAPFCSPFFKDAPPLKVLDLPCGNGFWSAACHDHFERQNHPNVSFTGLDIAPLAPDLKQQGMDWRFIQKDSRQFPMPFPDDEFDFIFVKDGDFASSVSNGDTPITVESALQETLRILKPGGVLEVWESDWVFRTLLPHPSIPPGSSEKDVEQAKESATYLISPSTAFANAQNKYLAMCNTWMEQVASKMKFSTSPCALTGWTLSSDGETMHDYGSRRVAIPFGEIRWERNGGEGGNPASRGHSRASSTRAAEKQGNKGPLRLNSYQAALRRTALTTTIQLIESLEAVLKAESGMQQDEWDRWWAGMTHNLLEENGTFNGECLEVGSWWIRKGKA